VEGLGFEADLDTGLDCSGNETWGAGRAHFGKSRPVARKKSVLSRSTRGRSIRHVATFNRRQFMDLTVGSAVLVRPAEFTGSSTGKIRAAVLGTGHSHAAGKIALLQSSSDFDLVGVCKPDEELRRRQASQKQYQNVRWLSIDEVLADRSVQLVAVEPRVQENLAYAQRAVLAGKHVHLDKPPGNDLTKLRSLLDEAGRRHLTVQMGYMWRYNKGIQAAIEAVRKGWLGDVYLFRGSISSDIAPADRSALALFPGGMMFELGCHLIDRMVDPLGRPSKVTPFLRQDGGRKDELADNTLAVFEFDRTLAEIYSTAQQPSSNVRRTLQIQGTNGTLVVTPIEPPSLEVDLKVAAGPYKAGRQKYEIPTEPRYVADFQEMARVIRKQRSASFSSKHDLIVQDTLLRACGVL
jgi:predicted dehydrogenase